MTAQFQFFQSLPHKKADFVKKKPAEHGVLVFDYFFFFRGKAFQLVEWETAGRYLLAVHLVSHKPCHSLLLLKAIVGWEEEPVKRRTNIYLSLAVTDTIYIFITICDRQNSLYLLDVHLTKSFDLLRMENKFTFTKNIAASVMSISVSHSLCLGQFLMDFILPLASCVF